LKVTSATGKKWSNSNEAEEETIRIKWRKRLGGNTYIRDNPMERTSCVSETVLSRSELTEILRRTRNHVIEQAKDDSASRF
jgi:hypothetical protein